MKKPYIIVWDLDDTIGDFAALHRAGLSGESVQVQVRPGLRETLDRLSSAGFVHTVLTLASPLYAEVALRGSGLRDCFVRVEGLGQRGKGDVAGLGEALSIPEPERPHRMLFIGDHPHYDMPRDPRVVFHLEPWGLVRPAAQFAQLMLHLREAGAGSLRQGFDRTGTLCTGWRRFWPFNRTMPVGQAVRRSIPQVGALALLARADECPVVSFDHLSTTFDPPSEYTFVPAEVASRIEQMTND